MPSTSAARKDRFAKAAERIATAGRAIQKNIDRKEKSKKPKKKMARCRLARAAIPSPPLPRQHIAKPGQFEIEFFNPSVEVFAFTFG